MRQKEMQRLNGLQDGRGRDEHLWSAVPDGDLGPLEICVLREKLTQFGVVSVFLALAMVEDAQGALDAFFAHGYDHFLRI